MLSKKTILSWIIGSIIMYTASYLWHGVFLNDLEKIQYSKTAFLCLAGIAYLIIGFVNAFGFEQKIFTNYERSPLTKGLIVGSIAGAAFYIVALVLSISFGTTISFEHIAFDFSWQVVEQSLGGLVVGAVHYYVTLYKFYEMNK